MISGVFKDARLNESGSDTVTLQEMSFSQYGHAKREVYLSPAVGEQEVKFQTIFVGFQGC